MGDLRCFHSASSKTQVYHFFLSLHHSIVQKIFFLDSVDKNLFLDRKDIGKTCPPPLHRYAYERQRISRNVGLDVVMSFSERLVYSNNGLPYLFTLLHIRRDEVWMAGR